MMKKVSAIIVVLAMIVAMLVVPSQAATITDSLIFNVDARTGSVLDKTGNFDFKTQV